jgi:hypothetical protein
MNEPATNVAAMPALREPTPVTRAIAQPMTPMEMLAIAVERGSTVEVMGQLMALQERYEAAQARKAFDAAISAAKAEIPVILKNRTVDFTSSKGRTRYDHEDLGEIARTVDPIISKYGLSYRFRARQEGKKLCITCVLSHRDGHFEENELSADNDETGNKNAIQGVGSTATFLQRYTLKLALGLAAAKDNDGRSTNAPAKITDAQVDELIALADAANADKGKFCEWLEVASIADIPASKFATAKNALTMSRRKKMARADQRVEDAGQGEVS